jgi:hypothetical protein
MLDGRFASIVVGALYFGNIAIHKRNDVPIKPIIAREDA